MSEQPARATEPFSVGHSIGSGSISVAVRGSSGGFTFRRAVAQAGSAGGAFAERLIAGAVQPPDRRGASPESE